MVKKILAVWVLFLAWGAVNAQGQSLIERVLDAYTELFEGMTSDHSVPYKKIGESKKYEADCHFGIEVELGEFGEGLFLFSGWWVSQYSKSRGPDGSDGSISPTILELEEVDLRRILSTEQSLEFIPNYYDRYYAQQSDPSVNVTVVGNSRSVEVRPIDDDASWKERNSTYYYRVDFVDDEIVQMEKKYWQKHPFSGQKELWFHDVCFFNPTMQSPVMGKYKLVEENAHDSYALISLDESGEVIYETYDYNTGSGLLEICKGSYEADGNVVKIEMLCEGGGRTIVFPLQIDITGITDFNNFTTEVKNMRGIHTTHFKRLY